MKFNVVLLASFCGISLLAYSQGQTAPPDKTKRVGHAFGQLRVKSTKLLPMSGALVGNAACDSQGNIYVNLVDSETMRQYGDYSRTPISKFRPDGSIAGKFKITDASPDLTAMPFFVTGDGQVFSAAYSRSKKGAYVVSFGSDGLFGSNIRIDAAYFVPYQLVVFPSGEFLLSGTLANARGRHHTPVTGVFRPDGRLIKNIYEPEDEDSRQRAAAGDPDFTYGLNKGGNTAVWFGDAALGSDGNAYLLRSTSPALTYVISPEGEVLRKLRIDSPAPWLRAQGLKSAQGELAISFLEKNSTVGIIKVVDLKGNVLGDYTSSERKIYPGRPGCYNSGSFTFLSTEIDNSVRLNKAEVE